MKRSITISALIFLMALLPSLQADADDTIIWYHADFPPFSIPYGPDARKGVCDRIEQFLIDHTEGYQHHFRIANYTRIMNEFKIKDNICSAALLKTPEREKFIEYSIPTHILLSNGVIIQKTDLHRVRQYINKDGFINLEEVVPDENLRIGFSQGRSYGGVIDEILMKYKDEKNIIRRSASKEIFKGLLMMMLKDRVDVTLGYPVEAQYVARQMGKKDHFLFFPVAGMAPYSALYTGCSKTKWGKNMISRFNATIRKYRETPVFYEFYEYWLTDPTRKLYRRYSEEFFQEKLSDFPESGSRVR